MKTRHVLIILSFLILIIITSLIAMSSYQMGISYGEKNAEEIRSDRIKKTINDTIIPKYVKTKLVVNDTVPFTIKAYGRIVSSSNVNISSEVQGEIVSDIPLKKGTEFTIGQTLFKIKDTDAKLLLIAKKSDYLSLLANSLPDLKIDFNSEFLKWQTFFNKIKVNLPIPEFPEINSIKEKNFIVSRSIHSQYFSIKSDEIRLKKYIITAPFDGTIIESFNDEGAIVNPGSPVITIIRKGQLEIEIPLSIEYIDQINIGTKVELLDQNNKYEGIVNRIGEFVNPNTQNLSIYVNVINSNSSLYNGMYLEAIINCKGHINVAEIPRRALFGNNILYLVNKDSLLIPYQAIIKAKHENTVSISGISDSSIIVIEPIINAKDSMKVWPIK